MNEPTTVNPTAPTTYEQYRAAASPSAPLTGSAQALYEDRNSPYWKADHPQHAEAVARVSAAFRERYHDEGDAASDHDIAPPEVVARIHDLRARVGVDVKLPRSLDGAWDHGAEADVLRWAIRENVPAVTMQKVLDFYTERAVLSGRGTVTDDDRAEFEREAVRWGLSNRQIRTLIAWERVWSGRA